jgi:hypothetical protein
MPVATADPELDPPAIRSARSGLRREPPCRERGSDKASGKLIKVGLANNEGAGGLQALTALASRSGV